MFAVSLMRSARVELTTVWAFTILTEWGLRYLHDVLHVIFSPVPV